MGAIGICITTHKICDMDKKRQDIAYFLAFCIEQYMNEKKLTQDEAMALLSEYGVLDYLMEHFEILHTQSRQWIIEDIDEFIKERKGQEL